MLVTLTSTAAWLGASRGGLASTSAWLGASRGGRAVASLGGSIDYGQLRGGKSFGREAGEWALRGEVPTTSNDGWEVATFAGGCFWGTELHFARVRGVKKTCVGYTQGASERPTYDEVCRGKSGHTEACQIAFDPVECSYSDLCELLFRTIDPTLRNRVNMDTGTQYRHGIYTHTPQQEAQARSVFARERPKHSGEIVTELKPATVFWPAEDEHQQYLAKGGRFGRAQSSAKGCMEAVRCYG